MTAGVQSRPMNEAERAQLKALVAGMRTSIGQQLTESFSPWVSLVICLVLVWVVAAWLGRVFFNVEFGWRSPFAPWITASCALLSALLFVPWAMKSLRQRKGQKSAMQADLEASIVTEEHFHLNEVKRFQEPEHGGLMYFLRTTDDKVYVLFDYESQDLGVDGEDPLSSTFRPHEHLVVVRAPASGFVLSRTFSGRPLELPLVRKLSARPKEWPESEAYCGTSWAQLDAVLGG